MRASLRAPLSSTIFVKNNEKSGDKSELIIESNIFSHICASVRMRISIENRALQASLLLLTFDLAFTYYVLAVVNGRSVWLAVHFILAYRDCEP